MDDNVDTWSILYSDPLITEDDEGKERRRYIFRSLANIYVKVMQERHKEITRVGVFAMDDHLVSDVLKYKSGSRITESTRMNGNIIHEGYIMISNDDV